MLISERHIFFEFLQFSWSKFFLTVVFEYAKNQKNSGHSVVSSSSATLLHMVKWPQNFPKIVSVYYLLVFDRALVNTLPKNLLKLCSKLILKLI